MSNIAVIIGNAKYTSQNELPCCVNDATAMTELLQAVGKFDKICTLTNRLADAIRSSIRNELESADDIDECFFYFSGHGIEIKDEFFYCGTEFDIARPNETGLSNTELLTILRDYNPKLVVKVIDACNSGTSLIKGDTPVILDGKGMLNDVIQIASCQSSQVSLTGNPLSPFTKHFCQAAIRRSSGPIFYTDIINTIRDDFLNDQNQTPHFVSQGTGRAKFATDAADLSGFSADFMKKWGDQASTLVVATTANTASQTMLQLIQEAENHFVIPEDAEQYIAELFDGITSRFNTEDFSEFYDVHVVEHDDYPEVTSRQFIIKSLNGEKRPDNFVTASITKNRVSSGYLSSLGSIAASLGEPVKEKWELSLNCSISRAQIKVTLSPKYKSLNQIRLVVSCAPSLNHCYIFEISTKHVRSDWDTFDNDGAEIDRKWYQRLWTEDNSWLVDEICDRIHVATQKHVDATGARLASAKAESEE